MNWLNKLIFGSLSEWVLGILDAFGSLINNIFQIMYDLNHKLNFDKVNTYVSNFALACLALYAIKQGLQIYVFNTDGDPDADPLDFITRISLATAAILCGNYVIDKVIQVAYMVSIDITSLDIEVTDNGFPDGMKKAIEFVSGGAFAGQAIILIFLFIFIVIAFVLFELQAAKRGAELILFQIIVPVAALDLLTTSKERWNAVISELIVCTFGYVLQLFSFKIFMSLFNSYVGDPSNMLYLFAGVGWLFMILSTPKWLQKFVYSSGVGAGAKGGVRTASFIIPSIMMRK